MAKAESNISGWLSLISVVRSKSKTRCQAEVAEWFTAPCLLCVAPMVVGLSLSLAQTSTNACGHICKYVDQKGSPAMLTSTVRGESEDHTGEKCKRSTLALKPRADVTRSPKQGHQWSHEKDLYPQKFKEKKE